MKLLSIVIPIYNEEEILETEVKSIINEMNNRKFEKYEIFLVENGSTDNTKNIAKELSEDFQNIKMISLKTSNYGRAIKDGILRCNGDNVAIFNIDFWDVDFLITSINYLLSGESDIVLGSKVMSESEDTRSLLRRFITKNFNLFLKLFFDSGGVDTHGLKLFRKNIIINIVKKCITDRELFDTEFILRSQMGGLRIKEIPVICEEKRKSTTGVLARVPSTIIDIVRLFYNIKIKYE